jgi:hypothetical protein
MKGSKIPYWDRVGLPERSSARPAPHLGDLPQRLSSRTSFAGGRGEAGQHRRYRDQDFARASRSERCLKSCGDLPPPAQAAAISRPSRPNGPRADLPVSAKSGEDQENLGARMADVFLVLPRSYRANITANTVTEDAATAIPGNATGRWHPGHREHRSPGSPLLSARPPPARLTPRR